MRILIKLSHHLFRLIFKDLVKVSGESQKSKFDDFLAKLGEVFRDKEALTHVAWHEIDAGSAALVDNYQYTYDKVQQLIIDYHI